MLYPDVACCTLKINTNLDTIDDSLKVDDFIVLLSYTQQITNNIQYLTDNATGIMGADQQLPPMSRTRPTIFLNFIIMYLRHCP